MAFLLENWDAITAGVNLSVNIWYSYRNTSDTIATIKTSAYFNNRINVIIVGDIIHCQGSDNQGLVIVTSVTTNVSVEEYVDTNSIPNSAITKVKVAPNSLDATVVDEGSVDNNTGIIPVLYRLDTPGGVSESTSVVVRKKTLVSEVWVINNATGTPGDIIQVYNASNPITGTFNIYQPITTITFQTTLNTANAHISALTILRAQETDGGDNDSPPVTVWVAGTREA